MSEVNGEQVLTTPIPETLAPPSPIEATVPPPNPIEAAEQPAPEPNPAEVTYIDYGIKLESGEIYYGSYLGRAIDTPESRRVMVDVLRKTAAELGMGEEDFVGRFRWVSRHVHLTHLGELPITAEAAQV